MPISNNEEFGLPMDISVVIPMYNMRGLVEKAIRSAAGQSYRPMEIIVVNDGSTDGSDEIVRSLDIDGLRLVTQENAGVSAARNRGTAEARYPWVAFLDSDDEWVDSFLSTIKQLHDAYPQCRVFATSYYEIDRTGSVRHPGLPRLGFEGQSGVVQNYFASAVNSSPPVCSSAVCISRESLQRIGGFPSGVKAGEDLITWARLLVRDRMAYHRGELSVIQSGVTLWDVGRVTDSADYVGDALVKLLADVEGEDDIRHLRQYIGYWYVMRASSFLRAGMKREARDAVIKSLRYGGFDLKKGMFFVMSYANQSLVNKVFRIYHR